MVYEKGTIKVVWITDGKKIYSKMFDNEAGAVAFSQDKQDYLIFKLEEEKDMENFTWSLLPYGRYRLYQTLLSQRNKVMQLLTSLES
jgi:hypothetical protein